MQYRNVGMVRRFVLIISVKGELLARVLRITPLIVVKTCCKMHPCKRTFRATV